MKKLLIFMIAIVLGIITVNNSVSAYNYDIAMHKNNLGVMSVSVSDFENNMFTVNISQQITNAGRTPAPDNCYYGEIILTNDQDYEVTITTLKPYASVWQNSNYTIDQYPIVLNKWFNYSFAIDSKGIQIADTPINQFADANLVYNDSQLSSEGGRINLGNEVILSPNESIVIYYDYSFDWNADNRTRNMQSLLSFDIILAELAENKTYTIETSVVNGIIDITQFDIAEGSNIAINYQTNEGYVLDKVIVDGLEQDITLYNQKYMFNDIKDNHSIHVVYKPQSYQIIYELDGGINHQDNPISYTYGEGVDKFNSPSKNGYSFLGWVDRDENIVTNILANDTGDKILYAKWEKNIIVAPEDESPNIPTISKPKPSIQVIIPKNKDNSIINAGDSTSKENLPILILSIFVILFLIKRKILVCK